MKPSSLRTEVKSQIPRTQRSQRQTAALLFPHQKFVLVFGLEHGSHLLQVHTVSLLLQLWGEENGDDPLGDVGQVEVVVPLHHSLHHAVHTEAPGRAEKEKMEEKGKDEMEWRKSRGQVGHREKGARVKM